MRSMGGAGWEEEAESNSTYHLSTNKMIDLHEIHSGSIICNGRVTFWSVPNRIGYVCSEH